jgi:hypothetical protein
MKYGILMKTSLQGRFALFWEKRGKISISFRRRSASGKRMFSKEIGFFGG